MPAKNPRRMARPKLKSLLRWPKSWGRHHARLPRKAVFVTAVVIAGLLAARVWLPAHKGAAPPPHRAAPSAVAPVDLGTAKWHGSPPEQLRTTGPPKAAPEGTPAWMRYAGAAPESSGRPMIAIVIDDVGVDKKRSARAVALPPSVTLAFLPYATDVGPQVREAKLAGHEILVHLPMEAQDTDHDPGPNALTTEISDNELLRRLRWDLERFDGYVGVNNHMGSRFTGDRHRMEIVISELKSRGLLFLDSRTTPNSVGPEIARETNLPFAVRQVFLDNDQNAEQVEARLSETERIARGSGYAVAIGHPHDATLAALNDWLPRVESQGFVLVPVSAIVRREWVISHGEASRPPG
jgi:polysaccharide deacetylase 2 family uncharacterized protein YibQ